MSDLIIKDNLAEALRLLRVFSNTSARNLASHIGISPNYLSEIENGKKKVTLIILEKYSAYFNIRKSRLLKLEEDLSDLQLMSLDVFSSSIEHRIIIAKKLFNAIGAFDD